MPRKPDATWKMLNEAWSYYQQFISKKTKPLTLSDADLVYVANFKGGNASITEPLSTLANKCKKYELVLRDIDKSFSGRSLSGLHDGQVQDLIVLADKFLTLTESSSSKIRGLGPSYASALLAAHFPDLIPILDRRILNGAGIEVQYNKSKQVKNIGSHYGHLIQKCYKALTRGGTTKTLRDLDKQWFVVKMP